MLEFAVISVVESGKMTKDLAILIYKDKMLRSHYKNTEEFLDCVQSELNKLIKGQVQPKI